MPLGTEGICMSFRTHDHRHQEKKKKAKFSPYPSIPKRTIEYKNTGLAPLLLYSQHREAIRTLHTHCHQ